MQTKAKAEPRFTGLFLWSKIPQLDTLLNCDQQNREQKKPKESAQRAIKLDAANAIKRVAELDVMAAGVNSLTLILNLTNMRVTHFAFEKKEEQEYLHLFCEYEYNIAICPCCGQTSASSHEGRKRSVRHLDI